MRTKKAIRRGIDVKTPKAASFKSQLKCASGRISKNQPSAQAMPTRPNSKAIPKIIHRARRRRFAILTPLTAPPPQHGPTVSHRFRWIPSNLLRQILRLTHHAAEEVKAKFPKRRIGNIDAELRQECIGTV